MRAPRSRPGDAVALQVLSIDLTLGAGARADARASALGPIDHALRPGATADETVFGAGPLADLRVPGSHRLVLCGRSPAWGGFYVSTVGSAAAPLRALELDVVTIAGRAASPSALVVERGGFRLVPVDLAAWRSGQRGTYGLIAHLRARGDFGASNPRILAAGPASATTAIGALASSSGGTNGEVVIDTWAGRGGFGSKLWRDHGLCAVVLDADPPPETREPLEVTPEQLRATAKYRYQPLLGTGGTFGSNFSTLREKFLGFNARTIYLDPDERERLYERLVRGHYLKQFKEEMRRPGASRDCGETCPAVCKKVRGTFKKDYQPYAALGPNIGVFDQRAAEAVNDLADALGFDSVDAGGLVGFALETDEALEARRPGAAFDPEADSAHNAKVAMALLERIAEGSSELGRGIRAAAAVSGERGQAALYTSNGEAGAVSPNQYWVPGMVAPVGVSGKYYVDYGFEFRPPRELGRACAVRMTRELALDNLGMCRFQREWAEERLGEMLGCDAQEVDAHHRGLARAIDRRADVRPWETARTVDLVATYLDEVQRDGEKDADLDRWVGAFRADRPRAARAFWEELRAGIVEGLS